MLLPLEFFVFLGIWVSSSCLLRLWNGKRKDRRRYPPSLPSLPLVGSLPFLSGFKNLADFFMKKADQLGPVFTFRAGSKLVLILNSREVIEDALINKIAAFSGRSPLYTESISNPNNKGLAMMNTSKEWKRYHQLTLSILKQFGFGVKSTMESRILAELEFIREFILKQNERSFNPREIVYLATTNVITNIVLGRRQDYNDGMSEIGYHIKRMFDGYDGDLDVAPILRFLPFHRNKLLMNLDAERNLQRIFRNEAEEILKGGENDCFVSRYLQHEGPDYDREQFGFTVRDLIGAGTDTTANVILWTLVSLANHPHVQNRLRAEIDAVIPRDKLPSMTDQPNLPYVDATSVEIMRWKTLAPLSVPHMATSDTTVDGYFVPAGTKFHSSVEMLIPVEWLVFLGIWIFSRRIIHWWNGREKGRQRYPPALPTLPVVGSLPFLRGFKNLPDFFMRKADELGPIFTFRAGSKLVLILNSKKAIEDALINNISAFSGRSQIYTEGIANPNRKGISMMSTTKEWKRYHQLSLSILKHFGLGVKSTMESRILAEFECMTEFILKQNGRSFNPRELVYLSTSNVISYIMFGHRQDYYLGMTELTHQIRLMYDTFDTDLEVVPLLRFLPFHRNKLRQNIAVEKRIQEIFREKVQKIQGDGAIDCFVSRYLEHEGPGYDAEQLGFTLRDLVAAATDTSANTVLFTLVALANNPDVQNRLRAEIDALIPRDRLPSMTDQPKLPYVDATCTEIMRWRTLVPLALPHMTTSDTAVGGYFVPASTEVLANLYAAHMDPKVWKDPETFRPERFLDKDGRVINKESVIAFSLGRRSCPGESFARAEFFLLLTALVQRFIIQPPEGQSIVVANRIEPVALILTSTEFNIRLIPRDEIILIH